MPSETLCTSETNSKRKVKNKAPKRLRRKNKPVNINTEENNTNDIPTTDDSSIPKQNIVQESAPLPLNTSPMNTDNNPTAVPTEEISMHYWQSCTKKALNILEKQASNRRKMFIERHQERIDSIQCLLVQREQIQKLTEENHLITHSLDLLRTELRTKDENLKDPEDKLYDYNDLLRDNEFLRVQLKLIEQKFDRFTIEYSKKIEEYCHNEHEYTERIQTLLDEIERIKRDLVLEEYRKLEAERKVRYYDEKSQIEQNLNKKMQQDTLQLKQELKSIHMKYDALQIEMLDLRRAAKNNDVSLIPTKDTNENQWIKKRVINQDIDEQCEVKRSKRKTRDRADSSASTTSDSIDQRNNIPTETSKDKESVYSNDLSATGKRKTLKSIKTNKKHLPMLTVTQASPAIDQSSLVEKDPSQLLLPPSVSTTSDSNTPSTDSHNTSCESQPIKPRTKKQSRYPCRRAQRPVKQIDPIDQIKQ